MPSVRPAEIRMWVHVAAVGAGGPDDNAIAAAAMAAASNS
jgi:hypothetical protein